MNGVRESQLRSKRQFNVRRCIKMLELTLRPSVNARANAKPYFPLTKIIEIRQIDFYLLSQNQREMLSTYLDALCEAKRSTPKRFELLLPKEMP
jgi:hypothetical protein